MWREINIFDWWNCQSEIFRQSSNWKNWYVSPHWWNFFLNFHIFELCRKFSVLSDNMIWYMPCTIIIFPFFVVCVHIDMWTCWRHVFSSLLSFHSGRWLSWDLTFTLQSTSFFDTWNLQFILPSVLSARWVTHTLISDTMFWTEIRWQGYAMP